MFSAVGFDLGGTLVDYVGVGHSWQSGYSRALEASAVALGLRPDPAAVARAEAVLSHYNTRTVAREHEVDAAVVFGEVFGALGCDEAACGDVPSSAVDAFFGAFRGNVVPAGGGVELVSALDEAGVPVGVLTDVPYGMPRRLATDDLQIAGLAFLEPRLVTSTQVGWRKPRADGFEELARRLGVECDEMLFVGDERKDIEGALMAGCGAVLIWRSVDAPPDWRQHETVATLGEVRGLVFSGSGLSNQRIEQTARG